MYKLTKLHLQRHYVLSDDDLVNIRLFLLEHV
jgi:hypothetical protein